jgi:hypothetical protein
MVDGINEIQGNANLNMLQFIVIFILKTEDPKPRTRMTMILINHLVQGIFNDSFRAGGF